MGIDIERKFRPTIQADYSRLPFRDALKPEMILAAPDCSCFSLASVYRYWAKGNPPIPKHPKTIATIQSVMQLKEEITRLKPRFAVAENPHPGMLIHVWGRPDHRIKQSDYGSPFKKPTGLWEFGTERLAWRMVGVIGDYIHAPRSSKKGINGVKGKHVKGEGGLGDYVRAPALRAKWPYGLSLAILEAVSK